MDPFRNLVGIGGAGCREVTVDPSRVQAEEFETAKVFAQVIWGPEGYAEMLGPTWYLVHDPRFLKIERMWARETAGMLGGVVRRGISIVKALDLASNIKVIEDPELYSEMLAEGRHFRDVVLAAGLDVKAPEIDPECAERLVRQECPNYIRRNGELNDTALDLIAMLQAGLVSLVDDYAHLAYSRDWIRMDTNRVVAKDEVIWDPMSGSQVPIIAVEVDTIHKALIMRAQVRTTALRLMKGFPGIKWEDFETTTLTDSESDQLCQLLFNTEYDKLYKALPDVLNLIKKAQVIPYDQREHNELAELASTAADFMVKLQSGEIEPIITSLEEDPNAAVDPGEFLNAISNNPYLNQTFTALQNLGERGDAEAEALSIQLFEQGGTDVLWGKVDELLLDRKAHPKQDVFEGKVTLTDFQKVYLREAFEGSDDAIQVTDPETDEPRLLTTEEIDKVIDVAAYSASRNPRYMAMAVVRRGLDAPSAELADLADSIQVDTESPRAERQVHVVEETNMRPEPKATGTQAEGTDAFYLDFK